MAVLDEEALPATCASIDLNPIAAGLARVPEAGAYTSIKARGEHVQAAGKVGDVTAAVAIDGPARRLVWDPEAGLWPCPVEHRHGQGAAREGVTPGG